MGELISVIYLLAFAASGYMISRFFLRNEQKRVCLWMGGVIALVMIMWLPALFSFFLGFTLLSQLLALAAAAAAGTVCFFLYRNRNIPAKPVAPFPYAMILVLVPLLLIGVLLNHTHTILPKNGALYVGQSTYGDLAMHLGFTSSIAEQKVFPPMYSICPDVRVGYPFLSDSIASTFYVLGASLRFATYLSAVYAYLLVLVGVWMFFERWLKESGKTALATLLFFVGGGFGYVYFFDLLKGNSYNFTRIFTAFYETPTNNVNFGIKWVNPIADMLVPQRATLFGWALVFPCLYLLYRAAFEKDARKFILLGIIAGSMPLIHTHSFLALGVISAVYFLRSLLKKEDGKMLCGYLTYAGIVALLAGPQLILFTFRQSSSFLTFHFNWANTTDNYFWFYIKNLGFLFLLMPPALITASRHDRAVLTGPLVLWAIAECVQFQPNPYDNNKLLFICFAYLCGLIADFLIKAYRFLMSNPDRAFRISANVVAAVMCVCLFLSGVLTLIREYVSEYQLFDQNEVTCSEFIKANTEPSATFLTHNNHNNTVAALTGRNIVCGSGSYLFFHGVDYSEREKALRFLYEEPEYCFEEFAVRYGIDYVYISWNERYNYDVNEEYFENRFPVFYSDSEITIYDVNQAL